MKPEVNISGHLRNRLFALLVVPMLIISVIFTVETYLNAQTIAKQSFDKSLTILTLAIMGQSEELAGDSLSENTLELINDSMGDVFFYHIVAPEGGFITGYSSAPQTDIATADLASGRPYLFDDTYKGIPVRAAFFRQYIDNSVYQGWMELTVWQYLDKQRELQNTLFIRSISRLSILVALTCIILWFGVRYGLLPLTALEAAITQRSIQDLSPIKRAVPHEVKSIVEAMNDLFSRLASAIKRRDAFLGNASHQLKTPLARIQNQAELAIRANTSDKKIEHIKGVMDLTKQTSRLTNQMLSLLRAESESLLAREHRQLEISELTKNVVEHYAPDIVRNHRELVFEEPEQPLYIKALPILLTEAISNLIENSIAYSYPQSPITISVQSKNSFAEVRVIDSGPGISREYQDEVVQRFYRVPGTKADGCGLGLSIVKEIVTIFSGDVFFEGPDNTSFCIGIRLPLDSKP